MSEVCVEGGRERTEDGLWEIFWVKAGKGPSSLTRARMKGPTSRSSLPPETPLDPLESSTWFNFFAETRSYTGARFATTQWGAYPWECAICIFESKTWNSMASKRRKTHKAKILSRSFSSKVATVRSTEKTRQKKWLSNATDSRGRNLYDPTP